MGETAPALDQAALVVNTRSRRGYTWYKSLLDHLAETGVAPVEAHAVGDHGTFRGIVQRLIQEETPLILIGGGDGTVSSVAGLFVGSQSVMGLLPFGTGNALARDLGIPADLTGACQVLRTGRRVQVDLGQVEHQHFVNLTSVGLTTRVALALDPEAKRRFGRVIYLSAVARALATVRPFRALIQTAEDRIDVETLQVVIGSGRYHAGPFPVAPGASIVDGRLTIYALQGTSRADLLRLFLNLPGASHVELPNVVVLDTLGGRLETSPSRRVTVDGEVCLRTPIEFSILPASLPVLAPQTFTSARTRSSG
jgi:diacylglycerol kinase (ATP)